MKETVNVSISGIAFILDKECYAMLSNYLNQTESSLSDNPNRSNIMADIEARIAEQILSVQSAENPVPMGVMRPIIEQLGGVIDGSQGEDDKESVKDKNVYEQQSLPLTKRLYRNTEGALLGGVCNGLATYFNTSVVLFRLLFLLPMAFRGMQSIWWGSFHGWTHWPFQSLSGTALFIYIILWIVIPTARTTRQKLEMKGEDITVSKLSRENNGRKEVSQRGGSELSNIVVTLLKVFAITIGAIMLISAIGGFIVGFSNLSIEINREWTPIPEALSIIGISYKWAGWMVSGIVLLPFISLFLLIVSGTFGGRCSKRLSGLVGLVWFALVVAAFVLVMSNIGELANMDWNQWDAPRHHWHMDFD